MSGGVDFLKPINRYILRDKSTIQNRPHPCDPKSCEESLVSTRWSTALSSKVNLPHAVNFRAVCGASLTTYPPEFGGNQTFVLHRVDGGPPDSYMDSWRDSPYTSLAAGRKRYGRGVEGREDGGAPRLLEMHTAVRKPWYKATQMIETRT